MPPQVLSKEEISTDISEDDVKKGFTHWRETTTTSPSGRHLGHYKALIQDPVLLRCLSLFLQIALKHGIAIPRWCKATNVMIEKDPGRPKINRLRIIHLFEADFNFILKLMWGHRLVRRATELDILHSGQHGTIPGRSAIDPIMLTQLTTDIIRVQRTNMIRFDNDASACYDRIIVALGMLAATRCGMPENAISTHAKALELMQYTVKTVYGISEENYCGTEFEPLFGTDQGSGASPAVWLTLVVILLHTLDRLIPERMAIASPNGQIHHERLSDAYVDDTTLGFTDNNKNLEFNELISRLQEVAQTWSDLLEASGGSLNFGKCSWYVVYWEWKHGRPMLRKSMENDMPITLHSKYNGDVTSRTTIRRKEPHEAQRMLGVHLTPTGDSSEQLKKYKLKADAFATRLLSPRLKRYDIKVFHRSIYTPTMRYGLGTIPAAHETEELQKVQSRVVSAMLQKMNVSSKLPIAIRHGPTELGGLSLYELRTEMGIEQIKLLRDSVYSNSASGKLIMINLHAMQLEAGVGFGLLEEPSIQIPYLTPTWLTSVQSFMANHNLRITITDQPKLDTRSETDEYIMQQAHLSRYTTSQQRDINLVRIFLQATTLSDLTDISRPEAISLNALDGNRDPETIPNDSWPRQENPSRSQKRLWKRYITSSFLRYVPYWKIPPLSKLELRSLTRTPCIPQPVSKVNENPTAFSSLKDYVKSLPRTQRTRHVSDVQQKATDLQIWRAFRSKERLIIDQHGTFGWVIATKKLTLYECGGPVDGPFDTTSSTRSELCGFASALLLIASLSRYWGLRHRCTFRRVTDSKSALSRVIRMVSREPKTTRRLPDDSDLVTLINSLLWEIRRVVTMKWIKGHQDCLVAYDQLPKEAQLNMSADFLATRYRIRGKWKPSRHIDHPSNQRISISLNGTRLTSQIDACIRYHINDYHLRRNVGHD